MAETPKAAIRPLLSTTPAVPIWKGYCAVLSGFLANFVLHTQAVGSLNAWGTFSIYVASYYYQTNPSDPLVDSCFFLVFPATCIIEALFFCKVYEAVGVALYRYTGARVLIGVCGVLFCGAFYVAPMFQSPTAFAIIYSIGVGVGTGMACYTPVWPCWDFFPHAKGKVTGIIAFGYGVSPVLFGMLFSVLANPNNDEPTVHVHYNEIEYKLFGKEVADNVRRVFIIMAIIYTAIFLAATALLFSPPTKTDIDIKQSVASHVSDKAAAECPSLKVMLTSWAFWDLALCFTAGTAYGIFIMNAYKTFGLKYYANDYLLSMIGSIGALLNGLGRLVFPTTLDYISFRWLYGVATALQTVLAATVYYVANHFGIGVFGVWISLSFFLFAGNSPVFAIECARIFGNK